MVKRAQAAIDFLLTYGFAILLVISIMGAFTYINYHRNINTVGLAEFPGGFSSTESPIISSDGKVKISLVNNIGRLRVSDTDFSGDGDCSSPLSINLLLVDGAEGNISNSLGKGDKFVLEWDCGLLEANSDFDSNLGFSYMLKSGLNHPITGRVRGKVIG